jgi:hypothetical protein
MTETSIHPLAATSWRGPTISVTRPYLAGAYAAAPKPITAKAAKGCRPAKSIATPTILTAFIRLMSRAFGIASAKGPISGARKTYDKVKANLSSGDHQPGRPRASSSAIVTISTALSASAETACAAISRWNRGDIDADGHEAM